MTEYRNPTSHRAGDTKGDASEVADHAKGAAQDVADSARREAKQVAGEATDQIRALYDNAMHEAMGHASTQQEKLAGQSRLVTDDLHRISRGEKPESDLVNQLLSNVTQRVEKFTTDLETKEPADLLRDVRRFAARRPAAFLAAAAGIGLVAGRLTRSLGEDARDDHREHDFDGRYRVPSAPGSYGPPATPGETAEGLTPTPDPVTDFDRFPETTTTADPIHDPLNDPFTPEERR